MNPSGKKFISVFLVLSLMMLSVTLYAKERRGAKLVITKKGGQQIKGELITVKPNSLLLLDTEGRDVSIDIGDIKVIRIVKKSKFWKGTGYGLLVGGGGGALLGLIAYETDSEMSWLTTRGEAAWHSGTFFGLIGATVGGIYSLIAGTDKTIQIEGMSDLEIRDALDKLRKKARIRDYK